MLHNSTSTLVEAENRSIMSGTSMIFHHQKFNYLPMKNPVENPAKNLHIKFVELGKSRNRLTRGLLLLLPEIYKSGIYRKYCATIVEYAGRFGGLSKGVVLKRLRLEKRLENKPILKEAILTEGLHKVALVAGVVTNENEEFLVKKLKGMSKPAVAQMAKEIREKMGEGLNGADDRVTQQELSFDGSAETQSDVVVNEERKFGSAEFLLCKAVPAKIRIELDEGMTAKFLQLKKKFGGNLQNAEVMEKILEIAMEAVLPELAGGDSGGVEDDGQDVSVGRKSIPGDNFSGEKSQQKAAVKIVGVNDAHEEGVDEGSFSVIGEGRICEEKFVETKPASRTIPPALKQKLLSKTAGKCAYPNCNYPAEIFHHTDRFAISHSHASLKPLCKIHHEFMHNGLVQNEQAPAANWQFDLAARPSGPVAEIDELYGKKRLGR